jgi:hypothetical protein
LTGDQIVGGGFSTHQDVRVLESFPVSPDKWKVTYFNPTNGSQGLAVYAVCLDRTP